MKGLFFKFVSFNKIYFVLCFSHKLLNLFMLLSLYLSLPLPQVYNQVIDSMSYFIVDHKTLDSTDHRKEPK